MSITTRSVIPAARQISTSIARRQPAAAAAVAELDHHETVDIPPQDSTAAREKPFSILAGVVLARAPLITRELTPFESSFYYYQHRLNQRLAYPFSRYFYYQKDTPPDIHYKKRMKEKLAAGAYTGYGPLAWNDELLVGAKEDSTSRQIAGLVEDAQAAADASGDDAKREVIPQPLPRTTDADRENNLRSLNRKLDRTMYLVVQTKDGHWQFPSAELVGEETLHSVSHIHTKPIITDL